MVLKRTKIIATLGPSTDKPGILKQMISAGVDLVRINLSHDIKERHQARVEATRACAKELGRAVGIIIDLQGPKIRISTFEKGFIELAVGDNFIIDTDLKPGAGNQRQVGIDYKPLPQEVKPGDVLLLDDGLIVFSVEKVEANQVHCVVKEGGRLSDHKGINRRGGGLSAESLTKKDREDIEFAAKMKVDYVAISFPRTAEDMEAAKTLLKKAGSQSGVIAKIERAEAIEHLDEIIQSSDAVMVARGDLGVEIDYAELPGIQKKIIARARSLDKAVITATQMMETMVHNALPTRAEVSDVANAVLDGTDAVMLSAETATGNFPDKTVEVMNEICLAAERQRITQVSHHRLECQFNRVDETIAMSAMYAANHGNTRAIVALTETGSTVLWMSRIRSGLPIYGLSPHERARGRMTLYRGVYPIDFDPTQYPKDKVVFKALQALGQLGAVQEGDRVVMTKGDNLSVGMTNTMTIMNVALEK